METMKIPQTDSDGNVFRYLTATLAEPTCQLPDGRTGYFQRSNGFQRGCLAAAVATAIQVPIESVPAGGSLPEIGQWLQDAGWTFDLLDSARIPDAAIWIGESPVLFTRPDDKKGMRHMYLMNRTTLVFDPASGWDYPGKTNQTARIARGLELTPC